MNTRTIRSRFRRACCCGAFAWIASSCLAQPASAPLRECSALEPVRSRMLLGQLGAKRAMWTVGDEGRVESNLGIFRQREEGGAWDFVPVEVGQDEGTPPIPETDDAESMARSGSSILVMGSHFGKKGGPIEGKRAFVAAFDEDVSFVLGGRVVVPALEVNADTMRIWKAVNGALLGSGLESIRHGDGELAKLVAPRLAEAKVPYMSPVAPRAVNIEGLVVLPEGQALVGLRYPCTADGHPILVRFPSAAALLDPGSSLEADAVWTVPDAGTRERPAGIRALAWRDGVLHIVAGNLDGDPEKSAIIADHPEGALAECSRLEAKLPTGGSRELSSSAHVPLGGAKNIEGIGLDEGGHIWGIADSSEPVLPEMLAK